MRSNSLGKGPCDMDGKISPGAFPWKSGNVKTRTKFQMPSLRPMIGTFGLGKTWQGHQDQNSRAEARINALETLQIENLTRLCELRSEVDTLKEQNTKLSNDGDEVFAKYSYVQSRALSATIKGMEQRSEITFLKQALKETQGTSTRWETAAKQSSDQFIDCKLSYANAISDGVKIQQVNEALRTNIERLSQATKGFFNANDVLLAALDQDGNIFNNSGGDKSNSDIDKTMLAIENESTAGNEAAHQYETASNRDKEKDDTKNGEERAHYNDKGGAEFEVYNEDEEYDEGRPDDDFVDELET